ncbi:uncharacterized protein HD556DRAFT_1447668 [Suillus plorans]|uniref:Uncharacterized protein n=1 Tax=Suillus plorans TaxID=116603 RepID=A0A9P7AFX7_9AGAM|nr:uncharacterized protein HD556DRAFT_1447668 [Suillus plorans]KAG1788636.1 hypothetical protein HD556DRAFT_1447668 [Suillus plorans]
MRRDPHYLQAVPPHSEEAFAADHSSITTSNCNSTTAASSAAVQQSSDSSLLCDPAHRAYLTPHSPKPVQPTQPTKPDADIDPFEHELRGFDVPAAQVHGYNLSRNPHRASVDDENLDEDEEHSEELQLFPGTGHSNLFISEVAKAMHAAADANLLTNLSLLQSTDPFIATNYLKTGNRMPLMVDEDDPEGRIGSKRKGAQSDARLIQGTAKRARGLGASEAGFGAPVRRGATSGSRASGKTKGRMKAIA